MTTMKIKTVLSFISVIGLAAIVARAQSPDMVFEDFEGANFGTWKVVGSAFATVPRTAPCPTRWM